MKRAVAIVIAIIMVVIMLLPLAGQIQFGKKDTEINNAEKLLANMSLKEKVCQLFIVAPEAISNEESTTEISKEFKQEYSNFPIGGII